MTEQRQESWYFKLWQWLIDMVMPQETADIVMSRMFT